MNQPATNVLPMPPQGIAAYNEFRNQLAELKAANEATVFDYESKKGNEAARSHIHKLRLTKGAIERVRKAEKAESLAYGKKVDEEAGEITAAVEAMIQVHEKVLDEIKAREEKRVADIRTRISRIAVFKECVGHSSEECANAMAQIKALVIDDSYDEFLLEAIEVRDAAFYAQQASHTIAVLREVEKAELERLRREQTERDQRDRDEAIRRESAEKARLEAEVKAKAEADAIAKKAEDERVMAATREATLKADSERLAREKIESEQRAERELREAEERRIAEAQLAEDARIAAEKQAEDDKIAAVEAEKARARREVEVKAREDAQRAADEAHRTKIRGEIMDAFLKVADWSAADACLCAILDGDVPHIQVIF